MFDLALRRLEIEKSRRSSTPRKRRGKGGNPDYLSSSTEQLQRNSGTQSRTGHAAINSVTLLPYGGHISYRDSSIKILNSCSLDNQMQIIYTLNHLYPTVAQFFQQLENADNLAAGILRRMITFIDQKRFAVAKGVVLLELMRLQTAIYSQFNAWNLFESEDRVLCLISDIFKVRQHLSCTYSRCNISGESVVGVSVGCYSVSC